MKTKHTPGPWTFDRENRDVVRTESGCNSILIAQLYRDSKTEANAQLIAAAPKMAEALELLVFAEGGWREVVQFLNSHGKAAPASVALAIEHGIKALKEAKGEA